MQKHNRFLPQERLVPERIREARLARGLTMQELAAMIGVTKQSISKYELGVVEPLDGNLNQISEKLKMPLSFFYKPVAPSSNRGTTFFRSQKTNAARAKEVMLTKSIWADELITYIESQINYPEINMPQLSEVFADNDSFSYEEIEDIALEARMFWKLGEAPIADLSYLLESNGAIIVPINSGFDETDACSSIINKRPIFFVDTHKECAVRSRFNLAHELGHLLLHKEVQQVDLEDKRIQDRIEKEANQFASCFLLPRNAFLLDVHSTSLESFLPLKQKWKVSIAALVYRCKDLEIFSENQYIYIQKQISAKHWRKHEPFDDEWACEEPVILKTAFQMLANRGDISKDTIIEKFRLSENDIQEICNLPKDFFGKSKSATLIHFNKSFS